MKLSDKTCKAAKLRETSYKLFDGGGLFLEITPNGSKLWRLKYRFLGKEKRISLGAYPIVSLADARDGRRPNFFDSPLASWPSFSRSFLIRGNSMGRKITPQVDLSTGFAKSCDNRRHHMTQERVIIGSAIRDLQRYGFDKGQATAMLWPKRGSRCKGLKGREPSL